jgi:hypothetical protein
VTCAYANAPPSRGDQAFGGGFRSWGSRVWSNLLLSAQDRARAFKRQPSRDQSLARDPRGGPGAEQPRGPRNEPSPAGQALTLRIHSQTVRDRITGGGALLLTGLQLLGAVSGGCASSPEVETQVGPDPADADAQTCLIPAAAKNNGCTLTTGNCVPRGFDASSPSVCIPIGNNVCAPAPGLGFLLHCGDRQPDPSLNCEPEPTPGFPPWCCVCGH